MTTEETELTFIRCPSCRSLVPAVATRCRMCGYSFESGAASAEEADSNDTSKSRSRVRQRTISASKEQVESLGNAEAASDSDGQGSSVMESFSAAILPGDGDSNKADSDAAGLQIEEPNLFDDDTSVESTTSMFVDSAEDDPEPIALDLDAATAEEPAVEESVVKEVPAAVEEPPAEEPVAEEAAAEEAPAEAEPEPVAESKEESVEKEEPVEAGPESTEENKPSGRKKRRRKRKRRGGTDVSEQTEEQSGEQPVVNGAGSMKASRPKTVSGEAGVLVGWLVNFASDPKGESSELRSGKFFVGRQQLRKHDMVLDRDGVSTPHCMVAVNEGQICVQDLMSERGTYVQRAGSDSFEEIADVADIEHGDRLKIGDYEVMVCLLPSE